MGEIKIVTDKSSQGTVTIDDHRKSLIPEEEKDE